MHCRKASLLLWHRSLLYNIQKICYIFATYLYVMPIICLVIFWTTRYQKSCILLVGRMLIVAAYIYHIKWVLFYLSVIQISLCVKIFFFLLLMLSSEGLLFSHSFSRSCICHFFYGRLWSFLCQLLYQCVS